MKSLGQRMMKLNQLWYFKISPLKGHTFREYTVKFNIFNLNEMNLLKEFNVVLQNLFHPFIPFLDYEESLEGLESNNSSWSKAEKRFNPNAQFYAWNRWNWQRKQISGYSKSGSWWLSKVLSWNNKKQNFFYYRTANGCISLPNHLVSVPIDISFIKLNLIARWAEINEIGRHSVLENTLIGFV